MNLYPRIQLFLGTALISGLAAVSVAPTPAAAQLLEPGKAASGSNPQATSTQWGETFAVASFLVLVAVAVIVVIALWIRALKR